MRPYTTCATERRRVGPRSAINSNSLLQRRGRIADRLRVERELSFRQLQSGGGALRPDGIEPGVQSLRRGKEIDVLADESGIDLGEVARHDRQELCIGQSSPMIATLWGVFAWHEFRWANQRARLYLTGMFAAYLLALVLIARAYSE